VHVLVDVADEEVDLRQGVDARDVKGLLEGGLDGGVVEEGLVVEESSQELPSVWWDGGVQGARLTPCSYALKVSRLFPLVFCE
jgi:hypothetical protein